MFGKRKLPGTPQRTPNFLQFIQDESMKQIQAAKKISPPQKITPIPNIPSPHVEPTKEERLIMSIAAKEAAFNGNEALTEHYRARGVSLNVIARAVGASGNKRYAEFLLEKNPQALNLANELAIGFLMIREQVYAKELLSRGAKADIVLARSKKLVVKPPVTTNTAHRRSVFLFFKENEDKALSIDSAEESFTLEDTL